MTFPSAYSQSFSRPVTITVDLNTGHPMLTFLADGFTIDSGVVMFYLFDEVNNGVVNPARLVQLIPLAKIEHLWQAAEPDPPPLPPLPPAPAPEVDP